MNMLKENILCVGGPLHGLRKKSRGILLCSYTAGGPDREWIVKHYYRLKSFRDHQFYWSWDIVPQWNRSGFVKPKS